MRESTDGVLKRKRKLRNFNTVVSMYGCTRIHGPPPCGSGTQDPFTAYSLRKLGNDTLQSKRTRINLPTYSRPHFAPMPLPKLATWRRSCMVSKVRLQGDWLEFLVIFG